MDITRIQTPGIPLAHGIQAGKPATSADFSTVLRQNIDTVNTLQTNAETAARDFVVGRAQSVHDTMITMEKADISLRLLTQMRNKAVEAYQEIMRMQI
jgi:flagellar hook-basal body complex protein FliE